MERNFRCRNGEIDLIARDGRYLVFIEVKYRKDRRSGSSFAAVGKQKQRTILKVALFYLIRNGFQDDIPCRFDVVGIDGAALRWIKNAFEYRHGSSYRFVKNGHGYAHIANERVGIQNGD